MPSAKKVPRWDDDPQNGVPECVLHWHPDRLRVEQDGGKWWLVDLWTCDRQRLKQGAMVVVERGGRAVVI